MCSLKTSDWLSHLTYVLTQPSKISGFRSIPGPCSTEVGPFASRRSGDKSPWNRTLSRNHRQDELRRVFGIVENGLFRAQKFSIRAERFSGVGVAVEPREIAAGHL